MNHLIQHYCITISAMAGVLLSILLVGYHAELMFLLINLTAITLLAEFSIIRDDPWRRAKAAMGCFGFCVLDTAIAAYTYQDEDNWMTVAVSCAVVQMIASIRIVWRNFFVEDDQPGRHYDGEFFTYDIERPDEMKGWVHIQRVYWCPDCNHLLERKPYAIDSDHGECKFCHRDFGVLPMFEGVPEEYRAMLEAMSPAMRDSAACKHAGILH